MAAAVAAPPAQPAAGPPQVDGVDSRRCRLLNGLAPSANGPVLYWMSRDQRCDDNWAFTYAQRLALKRGVAVHVVFCLVPKFLEATIRHYDFMLRGLREVEQRLRELKVPFHLRMGRAVKEVPALCTELGACLAVGDFSPLRVPAAWSREVAEACGSLGVPFVQLDAHNVVPAWAASPKQEVGARTIRKKVMDSLPVYLTDFPKPEPHPHAPEEKEWPKKVDWEAAEKSLEVDMTVAPVEGIVPGGRAGLARLEEFCDKRLKLFADKRNDPNTDALSGLSPYLHFGQISAQRCALRVRAAGEKDKALSKSVESFIEEAVVRRELSDNFCFYNPRYDSIEGAAEWAQKTLQDHAGDKREHLYTAEQLEAGKTHDDLWNAAQLQMVREGKMHGFLRMYWAKKILEWTSSPREALAITIRLNDRYQLDGRDPNGYVGCMWSICGVHDMGWAERPIFGKIRFMNYAGCKRKLDIARFVARYPGASVPAGGGGDAAAAAGKARAKAKAKPGEPEAKRGRKK